MPTPPKVAEDFESVDRMPDDALVSIKLASRIYGVAENTFWKWVREGDVPGPIRIGRITRWRLGELRKNVASKVTA